VGVDDPAAYRGELCHRAGTMMLFLRFHIGEDAYALEATQVLRILPLVQIKRILGAARGVAGWFNYLGAPTPVLDLSELAIGQRAARRLSTRILLVNFPDKKGKERCLGLIAERVTETFDCLPQQFLAAQVVSEPAPYLGPVVPIAGRLIQLVDVQSLLPTPVSESLFREAEVTP
jgi:chemotaxis-related protein WspB